MEAESWLKVTCEGCDTTNWYCQGDLTDQTVADVEGIMCYACGVVNYLIDMDDLYDCYKHDFDAGMTVDECASISRGQKSPE